MALRLVASGDGAALAIRDRLLPLIRARGVIEVQRDTVRILGWSTGEWHFVHWTPFNELDAGEASSPGYRHALARQHSEPDLPYGLDIWLSGSHVLSLLWADDGSYQVASFARGPWEEQVPEEGDAAH
jgi:hypothetical protein